MANWAVTVGAKYGVLSGLSMEGEGTDDLEGRRMTAGVFAAAGGSGAGESKPQLTAGFGDPAAAARRRRVLVRMI